MTSDRLADLKPETRALVLAYESAEPTQRTDEFTRLREFALNIQVCTSLSDEDATARANLMPSGTRYGWVLDPDHAAVPCAERPETHRHLIFEC